MNAYIWLGLGFVWLGATFIHFAACSVDCYGVAYAVASGISAIVAWTLAVD